VRGTGCGTDGGWLRRWPQVAQARLLQYDPWGSGHTHWTDTPWRRSALQFVHEEIVALKDFEAAKLSALQWASSCASYTEPRRGEIVSSHGSARAQLEAQLEAQPGLGRIVALHHRSSASYQIC
jgi:hypothetical protein